MVSSRYTVLAVLLLFGTLASSLLGTHEQHDLDDIILAYEVGNQNALHRVQPDNPTIADPGSSQLHPSGRQHLTTEDTLHDLRHALSLMQDGYFSLWLGKWTTAIDWTAAVTGTYISASLSSISRSYNYNITRAHDYNFETNTNTQGIENEINKYFAQTTAFYYGEEAFAIRLQAFDDMLWVVLGWLGSINFIKSHSSLHHRSRNSGNVGWHAQQFIPAFAHRARVFYELAEQGWDWRLCGGGMTWNPRLLPYKNAITNQLFISASIGMYLHFPGDENESPFVSAQDISKTCLTETNPSTPTVPGCAQDEREGNDRGPYNPLFRAAAVNGYNWLYNSGILNDQGLYTDGFHIRDYRTNRSATECNERNEMVYTYNQGVILSGLRALWEATGNTTYLAHGHELVGNVVRATGWKKEEKGQWRGLGYGGILMERCDPSGSCNQDGQSFKGIFFHHLTAFCEPLPRKAVKEGATYAASKEVGNMHMEKCAGYAEWVVHNAQAALRTRDERGMFGGWWGALFRSELIQIKVIPGSIDYRNVPRLLAQLDIVPEGEKYIEEHGHVDDQTVVFGDLNDRGRGRTVETQGAGLSVVRAMLEFLRWNEQDVEEAS
ncbi:Six-hairpin glycosidase [Setomelanomma holmii]|uniref:Six-hairpin glycosidase n=1 Tax=Setomelanomma holmii TaxID=210430 RepID=A0A9P4HD51_9PLEO|nr:Six-hairpin glycosidase [Setomelanomma holmii]